MELPVCLFRLFCGGAHVAMTKSAHCVIEDHLRVVAVETCRKENKKDEKRQAFYSHRVRDLARMILIFATSILRSGGHLRHPDNRTILT
jgi:hypothetical protein